MPSSNPISAGYVLVSDAQGNASWQQLSTATRATTKALVFDSKTNNNLRNTSSSFSGSVKEEYIGSGLSIRLPAHSKWVVNVSQLIKLDRTLKVYQTSNGIENEYLQTQLVWSDTNNPQAPLGAEIISDDVISGSILSLDYGIGSQANILQGTSIIENKTDADKTYYLVLYKNDVYLEPNTDVSYVNLFGDWMENSITAIRTED